MRRRKGLRDNQRRGADQTDHADQPPGILLSRDSHGCGRDEFEAEKRQAEDRQDHEPVQEEIAGVERDRGPRVRRTDPHARGEIVAVGAQPGNFRRLDVGAIGATDQFVSNLSEIVVGPPRREPGADVSAPGNGR